MKTFLTLMLGATILMGVEPAQAGILASTRAALRLLVSPVTANDQIFINNMKTNYELLKNFEAESGEESADYYPLVSVLLEIKILAKEVVDLSATLSSPMNDGYGEAVKSLHEKYDRAEKLWEQLEKLNNESPLAYFTDFIQNFGIKTAWAAGFKGSPEAIEKALNKICAKRGMEWSGDAKYCGRCCAPGDSSCLCDSICGSLQEDGFCCPRNSYGVPETDCLCEHSPTNPFCKCKQISDEFSYEKCMCENRQFSKQWNYEKWVWWYPHELQEDENVDDLKLAKCCKENDEECKCKAEREPWITGMARSLCCRIDTLTKNWDKEGYENGLAKCHCDADGWNWDDGYKKCCPIDYHWIPWSRDPS